VGAKQPPWRQRRDALHAGQQIGCLRAADGDALVRVQPPGRGAVALDEPQASGSRDIGNARGSNAFKGDGDECLLALRTAAARVGLLATDERLDDLDWTV
jgi:hypothetical protein